MFLSSSIINRFERSFRKAGAKQCRGWSRAADGHHWGAEINTATIWLLLHKGSRRGKENRKKNQQRDLCQDRPCTKHTLPTGPRSTLGMT